MRLATLADAKALVDVSVLLEEGVPAFFEEVVAEEEESDSLWLSLLCAKDKDALFV